MNGFPRSEWCYTIAGDGCFLVKLSISYLNEVEEFINTDIIKFLI
jgi:Lrp/AsnC family leucine-responsive transcriptional regulator